MGQPPRSGREIKSPIQGKSKSALNSASSCPLAQPQMNLSSLRGGVSLQQGWVFNRQSRNHLQLPSWGRCKSCRAMFMVGNYT